jgi:butyryl-CoA:acetoacetate CoA-transferase beta subunit (EC 2.8.3.9)
MDKNQIRETIARRAALEIKNGNVVNLGIGLPTLIANYLPKEMEVVLHSENGLLGIGPNQNLAMRIKTSSMPVADSSATRKVQAASTVPHPLESSEEDMLMLPS